MRSTIRSGTRRHHSTRTWVVSAIHLAVSTPSSALCSTVAGTPTLSRCTAAAQSICAGQTRRSHRTHAVLRHEGFETGDRLAGDHELEDRLVLGQQARAFARIARAASAWRSQRDDGRCLRDAVAYEGPFQVIQRDDEREEVGHRLDAISFRIAVEELGFLRRVSAHAGGPRTSSRLIGIARGESSGSSRVGAVSVAACAVDAMAFLLQCCPCFGARTSDVRSAALGKR